ncbi:MFS transporter [Alkalicoccobacillus gibsonii]|uniref:MFS transporter n=1 Tax=Alkalicoccobacillus gibsonii TaxID=79881 RepID=A0ABU9VFD2_9BACI
MNAKVYILALSVIAVGLVELIVGGILPVIADDMNVSLSAAGQLITVFALVFAIAGPILLVTTSKIERKSLYLTTLLIFFVGNILTYFSTSFSFMMVARVITAASTALIVVLSLTMAVKVVESKHKAKALGLIYMGISSSLVLGVPIGILVSDLWGWRVIFLGIALLSLGSMTLIYFFMDKLEGETQIPLSKQLKALGQSKMIGAHLATMFMLAGHYTIYAYFTPFLETNMQLDSKWISVFYFIFGMAAISGGAFGGMLSDRIGSKPSILIVIGAFAVSLFLLPFAASYMLFFIPVMIIWGALSWSLAPAQQSYLIESDPVTSDIQQSFNNSALQIGISIGSAIGGFALTQTGSVSSNAWFGGGLVILAFLCAIYSFSRSTTAEKESIAA